MSTQCLMIQFVTSITKRCVWRAVYEWLDVIKMKTVQIGLLKLRMLYATSMMTIKKISIEYTKNDEKKNKICDTTKKNQLNTKIL